MSENLIDLSRELAPIYSELLEKKDLSDITFVVHENAETKEFHLHRVVLANQSQFLYKLLYNQKFMEANQTQLKIKEPLVAFEKIIKFIYTGKLDLEKVDFDEFMSILELSHRYELTNLENTMIDKVDSRINSETYEEILQAADMLNSVKLKQKYYDFIDENSSMLLGSVTFLKFTMEQVIELFERDSFKVTNIDKFMAISKWLNENSNAQKEDLLKYVDLSKLTNDQIINLVSPSKLFYDTFLMRFLSKRSKDVDPEYIETRKNLKFGQINVDGFAKVVVGKCNHNYLRSSSFCQATDGILLIDLGSQYTFNYFNFEVESAAGFEIECSNYDEEWIKVFESEKPNRFGPQQIDIPRTTARFIKFIGRIQVKGLTVHYLDRPCARHLFKGNKINREFGKIQGVTDESIIFSGIKNYTYAEASENRILVLFFQPMQVQSVQIRFSEVHNRVHIFSVHLKNENGDRVCIVASNVATKGWNTFKFSPTLTGMFDITCESITKDGEILTDAKMRIEGLEIY